MTKLAKIFINGRSQEFPDRPQEFRFTGTQVRDAPGPRRSIGTRVSPSVDDWFADLDRFNAVPFPAARNQPASRIVVFP